MSDATLEHDDIPQNTIVDFDAGDGETAAAVKMETYSSNLNVAKQKSVRLVDAITGAPLKRKDAIRVDDLRPALAEYIRNQHPAITRTTMSAGGPWTTCAAAISRNFSRTNAARFPPSKRSGGKPQDA